MNQLMTSVNRDIKALSEYIDNDSDSYNNLHRYARSSSD